MAKIKANHEGAALGDVVRNLSPEAAKVFTEIYNKAERGKRVTVEIQDNCTAEIARELTQLELYIFEPGPDGYLEVCAFFPEWDSFSLPDGKTFIFSLSVIISDNGKIVSGFID